MIPFISKFFVVIVVVFEANNKKKVLDDIFSNSIQIQSRIEQNKKENSIKWRAIK